MARSDRPEPLHQRSEKPAARGVERENPFEIPRGQFRVAKGRSSREARRGEKPSARDAFPDRLRNPRRLGVRLQVAPRDGRHRARAGRSDRAAVPRAFADSAASHGSRRCRIAGCLPRNRMGMDSSPRREGSRRERRTRRPPGRGTRAFPREAGGWPRARRGETRAARPERGRLGERARPRRDPAARRLRRDRAPRFHGAAREREGSPTRPAPAGKTPATDWIFVASIASPRESPGQDRREASREHRLSGSRRTAEQNVVAAGRGDLESPAGDRLPANFREVDGGRARPSGRGPRGTAGWGLRP